MTICLALLSAVLATAQQHPCLPCHPDEVKRFEASAMGRSLGSAPDLPDGVVEHRLSGSRLKIYKADGVMHHELQERGLVADYPIAYAIGAGTVGQSFLVEAAGHLFESPASFYTARTQWDVSPGYEGEKLLDFNRSITSDCLFCHSNSGSRGPSVSPISCDRCHGSTEEHLRNPVPGSVVNPAKLEVRQRNSVCEQCHLEGATAVLNPGRYWWDFKPGETLESVEAHYVYRSRTGDRLPIAAVSQAEQLALSRCFRESAGRLWCGSCHDPHGPPAERMAQIRNVCASCHTAAQIARTHSSPQQDCAGCHMPRRAATDIAHAAVTDHRIEIPGKVVSTSQVDLTVWHDPGSDLSARDFALGVFYSAKRTGSVEELRRALELLNRLPASGSDDAVLAAKGYLLLGSGSVETALRSFREALGRNPGNSEYWLELGVAEQAAGHLDSAVNAFRRSINLAVWDYRPYEALARLKSASDPAEAKTVREEYLRKMPQSILIRLNSGP